jgi:hypothetical protein
MKDANKLTPLLRSDDLIQVEKARFIKTISRFGNRLEAQVKVRYQLIPKQIKYHY